METAIDIQSKTLAMEGVKILDLTRFIAGPFCTKLLGDYGADVVKVEHPKLGDGSRYMGPFPNDKPDPEKSGTFLYLNTNKRGITINLKHSEGLAQVMRLVDWADVIVENFKPGVMDRLGIGYSILSKDKPQLLMVSVSNFGQTGPYKDFKATELTEYAMGGSLHATGTPDRPPVKLGGNIGLYQTGQAAAFAATTALLRKEMTGQGDHIDISIFETQAANQDRRSIFMVNHQYTQTVVKRHDDAEDLGFGIFPCNDGSICFWSGVTRFPRAAELVGREDLLEDPMYTNYDHGGSQESVHHFNNEILLPWLLERSVDQAWLASQNKGLATAPIFSPGRFFEHQYYRERGFWQTLDHPEAGPLEYPGPPFKMSATPAQYRRPAPRLGEHNVEIIEKTLGQSPGIVQHLKQVGGV